MAFIQGLLGLCSGFANGLPLEPPSLYGYQRQPVSFGLTASGSAMNDYGLTFGPIVTSGWGTLVGFGVFDQVGNLAYTGTLNQPLSGSVGDIIAINSGTFILDLAVPLPGGIVLAGFQQAIPGQTVYGSGAYLQPPLVSGGVPTYVTTGGFTAPVSDSSYTVFAPSGAGFIYSAPDNTGGVTFTGSGTIPNGTLTLPASFPEGSIYHVGSTLLTVSALTVSPGASGVTVYGSTPALSPDSPLRYRYLKAGASWVKA